MGTQELIVTLIGMIAVTVACRALPLTLLGKRKFPPIVEATLKYVPISILSAMLTAQVLLKDGKFENALTNTCLWITSLTFIVAFASRNLLMTVAFGILATAALRHAGL